MHGDGATMGWLARQAATATRRRGGAWRSGTGRAGVRPDDGGRQERSGRSLRRETPRCGGGSASLGAPWTQPRTATNSAAGIAAVRRKRREPARALATLRSGMSADPAATAPDWEAFHRNLRQPGYVCGYEILGKLGSGMSGHVYRARKAAIGKDYAIKFLQIDDAEVAHAVQAELDQLRHFAQIDHPNLVAIEDRGLVDGIPFVVMAFAGSETLRDRMPKGAPPAPAELARLRAWFAQAASGVQALHDHGLVHFDVKPQN
ncbi:MAG: hypothetical protein FJ306_08720, partial [Planctomycetes bacterium]|nr:hypothetical protein [Planctomycetota bacterium]